MKLLITGGTGFIGRALLTRLAADSSNYELLAPARHTVPNHTSSVLPIGDLGPDNNWSSFLPGVEVVIHVAARAHVMNHNVHDSLAACRVANTQGTLNLACQAAAAGVRRFVFISSIKVNGEVTFFGKPFTAEDEPAPTGAYAISKSEAEDGLRELAVKTGMEVVIIRPPLVYGSGVKANFLTMMRWMEKGVPLPFGAIYNRRSLVALDNLVDMVVTCIDHPDAANQTFLVADGEDMSTTDLLRRLANAMGRPARLIPVPQKILEWGLFVLGREGLAQRLCGSLQVDIAKNRELLGWSPPISVDEGLRCAVLYMDNDKVVMKESRNGKA